MLMSSYHMGACVQKFLQYFLLGHLKVKVTDFEEFLLLKFSAIKFLGPHYFQTI